MLVNSIIFWFFFFVVLIPYFSFLKKNSRWQNLWVLLASYFFYGYADWRMVPLLLIATIVFYILGIRVAIYRKENGSASKKLATLGVIAGACMLLYFKYLNFFVEQFAALFGLMGMKTNWSTFNIIVPIGISFFTFKLISYVVEVYKGSIEPTRDFVSFATYVAFFPTIMSGPIDAPNSFIPQMKKARTWSNQGVTEGLIRVLWGMFLKMCIADKVSPYTDAVFNNYAHHSGLTIIVAAIMYTFQIYTDFSGYSEMAIGTAQIMGFKVTENFFRPYFSTNVGDFWRRWHASLMNWFRDYIYFPLGGSRCSKVKMYRNTMVVFLVSGLWHGANWTFVFWGAYHGALVCVYKWIKRQLPSNITGTYHFLFKYASVFFVFMLVTIGWMVFRCDSFGQFWGMLSCMTSSGHFFASWALTAILPIGVLLFKELKDEEQWNIHLLHSNNWVVKAVSVALLIVFIAYMGELEGAKFIYFQF